MLSDISRDLLQRVERELPQLKALSAERAARKPADGGWSPKEELGHLIDSAANNHQRFVRAIIEGEFRGQGYAQDEWVKMQGYQEMEWPAIVELWRWYNTLLAHVIGRIPDSRSTARVVIGWDGAKPLGFIIADYVIHMQHHLDHLLSKPIITPYPPPAEDVTEAGKTL
jgi:hypothetical protein